MIYNICIAYSTFTVALIVCDGLDVLLIPDDLFTGRHLQQGPMGSR